MIKRQKILGELQSVREKLLNPEALAALLEALDVSETHFRAATPCLAMS